MLHVAAHHAKRALSLPRYYGSGLLKVFMTEPVFLWAQAIAFKTLVTLLPLLLLATGIFGLVLRQEDPFRAVAEYLRTFLPPTQSDGLVDLVYRLQEASGTLTFVGAAFFFVTVLTLFSTLRYVVGAAMGETRHRMRTIVGGYVFDLRMIAQVGSLFLLSFGITAGVRVLSARSGSLAAQLGLDADVVTAATGGLLSFVTLAVPYVLTVGMLAQLYHFVPRPRAPLRSAAVGAAVAAALFEAAKNGFAYYATYVGDFNRYASRDDALGGLGGVFGLILAFVFWVYLSGLILVVGAVVSSLHERRHRPRRSRLRRLWSRMGTLRRQRQRTEDAPEAPAPETDAPGGDGAAPDPPDGAPPSAPVQASPEPTPAQG